MPELPEVETVVKYLAPKLKGQIITQAHLPRSYKKAIHQLSLAELNKRIKGQKIIDVKRRAKFIVLELEKGILCFHLRMTGRIILNEILKEDKPYVTAWFTCKAGSSFYFKDVRKFGKIYFYSDPEEFNNKLGIEPLSEEFTPLAFEKLFTNKKGKIKPLLLDQKLVVGIGNIYADEILWAAKIHPERSASNLNKEDFKTMCNHTKKILKKSIDRNGTTFQSFYFGEQASGEFQEILKVFGRQGKNCSRCKSEIKKIRVAQRGTHYCPVCQAQ